MLTVDPKNLPTRFKLSDARRAELGEHPRLLDGLLYVGATVLYSEPGLGKSMLSGQLEEHLAYGRPFGGWIPDHPVRGLVLDFEGDMRQASERSLRMSPFGILRSDHGHDIEADIYYATEWPGESFWDRLDHLRKWLEAARDAGKPIGYVRIDTMRFFLGSKPPGSNAYDWDARCILQLNRLALDLDVCLVLVHHTNKSGELSGSTGVAGSATCVMQLKRNPDHDDECLLISHKVRVDAPFRHALAMDEQGRWTFTEAITPTQAQFGGVKRALINWLTSRGPSTIADLRGALPETSVNTIKSALRRLNDENVVRYRHGAWQLTAQTLAEHPKCQGCGTPMEQYEAGQHSHPTCTGEPFAAETVEKFLGPVIPAQQGPVAAAETPAGHPEPADDDEGQDEHPEAQKFPSFNELKASVNRSKMHPVKVIDKPERETGPWPIITSRGDQLGGHFKTRRDCRPVPEGTTHALVLDRNGAFPSAMSSVPVAANRLVHTGPLSPLERKDKAGIFRVVVAEWDAEREKMPHPLGDAMLQTPDDDGAIWLVGPHLEYLDKLAAQGRMKVSRCLESWSGRRVTNLFEPFSAWARKLREETARADEDTKAAAKRAIVVAIRCIHRTDEGRSPFWRPDWHKAILAEASLRHWIVADKAVKAGAELLSIGATDEVTFAVPADADPELWVPEPYRLGAAFGQVKRKEIKVDGEYIPTPAPIEQWVKRRG